MTITATHPLPPIHCQGLAWHAAHAARDAFLDCYSAMTPAEIAYHGERAIDGQQNAEAWYRAARLRAGLHLDEMDGDASALAGADELPRLVILSEATIVEALALPYMHGLVLVWNAILTACGQPKLGDSDEPLRPGRFLIPQTQATRLLQGFMDAADISNRVSIGMHWVNVGPSAQEGA